ncbi:MAG: GHMP kinase [Candidatus Acidiferrales bacterium]
MRIDVRAPTRIDLAGGTLDIWPLYLFHDGAVTLNCAISRYARCSIEFGSPGPGIELISRDTKRAEKFASIDDLEAAKTYRLPLLAHMVRHFRPQVGFKLTTDSEAPAGAGIGGSSAIAVAICMALDRLTGAGLSRFDWIHISRDIEAIVIGVPTGTQDHYPPAFGGIQTIHLEPGAERREPVRISAWELERRLVLCYSGKPRQSGINNWKVFQAHINGDRKVRRNFREISAIAQAMKVALERTDWKEMGRLMRAEWDYRKKNLPSISTPLIDAIIARARKAGALAGKVCGAGGGGCVALLSEIDNKKQVEKAVAEAGGQLLPVRIDLRGAVLHAEP